MKKSQLILSFAPVYVLVLSGMILLGLASSRAVTTISKTIPLEGRTCIVIDAGHGSPDGGATSCTGVLESTINLEIALRLDELMHLLGYKTTMVRSDDRSVYTQGDSIASKKISDLKERVRIVNETDNALLISIHQNIFSDSKYYGAQVFYAAAGESQSLAENMQKALITALNPESNRQIKKSSGVYLMDHISCTGVLVECGFLSNPEEEAKLRSPEYQKKLCCVIASAVSKHLDP